MVEFIIIVVIVVLSGPIAPFILAFKSLFSKLKWKKVKQKYKDNFWLNKVEKEEFIINEKQVKLNTLEVNKLENSISEIYSIIKIEINKLENSIREIYSIAERENISRNADNSISNRSNRGKQLNKKLNELYKSKREYENLGYIDNDSLSDRNDQVQKLNKKLKNLFSIKKEYEKIVYEFRSSNNYLSHKHIYAWQELEEPFVLYQSYFYTSILWLIGFYYCLQYFFKKPILALFEMYDGIFLNRQNFIVLKDGWGFLLLITLIFNAIIALIGYYILKYFIERYYFRKLYPRPPKVNIDNLDIF